MAYGKDKISNNFYKEGKSWKRNPGNGNGETAALGFHLLMTLPGRGIAVAAIIYAMLFMHSALLKIALIVYIAFTIWDRNTPHRGGRRLNWLRRSNLYRYMASYFPLHVKFTAEVPPEANYLLVSHPHGVWFFGYTLAFGADVWQLEDKMKLKPYMTTLNSNFWLPLAREYLLAIGQVTASEESLEHLLTEPKGGNLVCLLPGGSSEAAYSAPLQYRFLLNRRKGFCRIALQTGASLLPSISFGEVDCYNLYMPPVDSWISKLQLIVKDYTGIYPLIYKSPGSSWYMGLPKRTPITIVVGTPIKVTKTPSPSREQIAQLHEVYVDSLKKLFETEKHKYLNNADSVKLVIE